MLTLFIYTKDHRRRPIRLGIPPFFRDVQGQIPSAWCPICGSEVFEHDQEQCTQCRKAKGENRR